MGRNTHIVFGDNHDIYNPIKLTSALLVSSALLLGCGSEAPSQPKGDLSATASASDISRRIEKLASDEFEGRAPSTPGGQAASQYIANEMKTAGLSPMGENGTYFQSVELTAHVFVIRY